MCVKSMDRNTELRNLPPNIKFYLGQILDTSWEKLMEKIPKELGRNGQVINKQAKYNADNILLLEKSKPPNTYAVTILLEEWGTSGKIRPTLGHLLDILIDLDLYRAADYIAEELLNEEKPKRPSSGPAAPVPIPPLEDDNNEEELPKNSQLYLMENRNNPELYEKGYSQIDKAKLPDAVKSLVDDISTSNNKTHTTTAATIETVKTDKTDIRFTTSQSIHLMEFSNSNSSLTNVTPLSSGLSINLPDLTGLINSNNNNIDIQSSLTPDFGNIMQSDVNLNQSDSQMLPAVLQSSFMSGASISSQNHITNNDLDEDLSALNINSYNSQPIIPMLSAFQSSNNIPNLSVFNSTTNLSQTSDISQQSYQSEQTTQESNFIIPENLKKFEYNQILTATNNFNENERKIGSGGFSNVYLAINLLNDIQYSAIKRLKNNHDKYMEKFYREIEILSKCSHPNIVKLLGYSRYNDELFLIYEFIKNGNLEEKLRKCRLKIEYLDWKTRIKIAIGCAEGISYLHSEQINVVHRDIKSANILLDNEIPKICDFGLIKSVSSKTTTQASGTNPYMAPETIRGSVSKPVDIFSFGVVILELITTLSILDRNRSEYDLVTYFENFSQQPNYHMELTDRNAGNWGDDKNLTASQFLFDLCLNCLKLNKNERPNISNVLQTLNNIYRTFC